MEARAGNSILDFETLFSDFQELLNGSGLRYVLLAWTRVWANSERGRSSGWAVRVGQRLQLRLGKSGEARELGLVQIVVEASAIRGGFPKPTEPVFAWRCRNVLGDYEEGLFIRPHEQKHLQTSKLDMR